MEAKSKHIQLQFQGFLKTPFLWKNHDVMGLKQLELPKMDDFVFDEPLDTNLRLGKRVERFVSAELKQHKDVSICCENVQIQQGRLTLGELDCILKWQDSPIHLEIVFKFYLYDNRVGNTEIDHWIGPNRNDTLIKKLYKLGDKQLPLLYNASTKFILDDLNLNASQIQQRVYFKAQLFLPYKSETPKLSLLNKNCLKGFYVHFSELRQFENCKFYIPSKVNWLMEVKIQVDWLSFALFYEKIEDLMKNKVSTLCWIKFPNGNIQKFFVVWWK
ncbi:DUF1853 family protein [Flavobacteriaceae bacterium SZ-1-7]|uniref:DUF1853 family protein n=1 Tax=Tamlana sedimenti TaxID=3134126 RepID=UPI00312106CD